MNSWFLGKGLSQIGIGSSQVNTDDISEVNETAAYRSFVRHWQQAKETISQSSSGEISNDDVTVIINLFGQLIHILCDDLRHMYETAIQISNGESIISGNSIDRRKKTIWLPHDDRLHTPIFDHFMGEQILNNILNWSLTTGEYVNILKLEMLKAYELLLSEKFPEILVYKPITTPLLNLLQSCSGCVPVDVEKRLVVLLNQLCDSLMNNPQLLDYFFHASEDQGPTNFLIFSLLLQFIHREGSIGQEARDALLLCMSLSTSHSTIGEYIAQYSNFCPVLAAGLSGLYSMLPRKLKIESDGWYRLSKGDVATLPELQMFINSLEFCNAVVIVAHPLVRKQLVEFLYQGFLVPVLGPALCQNVNNELIAAIAYVELFIRTVSESELRRPFLALLLTQQDFTDLPLVSSLISHLHSTNLSLCLVTLSLFNTLISLHSEDVMFVLIFQYLTPCTHVMLSQRSKVSFAPFHAAERFLRLVPTLVQYERLTKSDNVDNSNKGASSPLSKMNPDNQAHSSESNLLKLSDLSEYLDDMHSRIASSSQACSSWTWAYNGSDPSPSDAAKLINVARVSPAVPYSKPRVHSDPSPLSLPHTNADVHYDDNAERSSSLPDYINDASEPHKCDKIPLRFSLFSSQTGAAADFKRVIDSKSALGKSSQKGSLLQRTERKVMNSSPLSRALESVPDRDETFGSFGESSGYESFVHKNSEESSPQNSTKEASRLFAHFKTFDRFNYSDEYVSSTEVDQDFLLLLEEADDLEETSMDEIIRHIDEFHSKIAFSQHSSNDISSLIFHSNSEEELFNTPWLNLSSSSDEEDDKVSEVNSPHPKPTIGPFLEVLIKQVEEMLSRNLHCSLIVMDCLTKLACYPSPLLTSLLLQPSLVLQPAVRSLFQVLGKLKQKIDNILTLEDLALLIDARNWLYENFWSDLSIIPASSPSPSSTIFPTNHFFKGDLKRKSLVKTIGAIFNRTTRPNSGDISIETTPDGHTYRYTKPTPRLLYSAPRHKRHAALCSVVLREWILELSACIQEHTVRSPIYHYDCMECTK